MEKYYSGEEIVAQESKYRKNITVGRILYYSIRNSKYSKNITVGRILYYSIRKALQTVNIVKTLQWGGYWIIS